MAQTKKLDDMYVIKTLALSRSTIGGGGGGDVTNLSPFWEGTACK